MHKNWGSCYLKIFKPSKSWWFFHRFRWGLFCEWFFGSPGFVVLHEGDCKILQHWFLSEAEFCTGIVQKKQNPRFVSRFSWCFKNAAPEFGFPWKNVSFPQNAKNFERLSNTEGLFICARVMMLLGWSSCDNSINRPENHQNYQPTDPWRMGPFNLSGPFTLTSAPSWEHHLEYVFFKFTSVLTYDSPNTQFCNSLPTKKDIPFHHSSGTRNDRSAQVVASSKICSCALKPDDRHLLMVSSTRSLGVEVGDKFMTSKVNWLVTNPDLESFQSVKVVCAS